MHDWKHTAMLALYISIGLIVAGLLQATVSGFLTPLLGGTAAPTTA